jgi:uncharacterized membrane protein YhaH (DUF805 family)
MGNLLFSPSGRISPADFMKGALVLIVIGAVLNILPMISFSLSMVFGLLGLVTLWCWIVLFIKRFHDAGKSGWMCLLPILAFLIIGFIVNGLVSSMFAGDLNAQMQQMSEEAISSGDVSSILKQSMDLGAQVAKKTALPLAVAGAVISYLIAYVTNMMLKSDAGDNQFGPATT